MKIEAQIYSFIDASDLILDFESSFKKPLN